MCVVEMHNFLLFLALPFFFYDGRHWSLSVYFRAQSNIGSGCEENRRHSGVKGVLVRESRPAPFTKKSVFYGVRVLSVKDEVNFAS